jgi:hypothetical protein
MLVIYRFQGEADGLSPGSLLAFNGLLYGIAYNGGVPPFAESLCCGTIFQIAP